MGLAAAIFATVVCLLSGYITLGALISGQVFWLSLVGAAAFLLLRVIDDLIGVGFGRGGWARRTLASLFRLSSSTVAQIGILAAAGMQLLVLIGALALALTPFGQSGDLLLGHLGRIGEPLRFGTATLSLPAIATGVGCLAIGVTLARFVRDWVVRRYLPATTWDTGVRNSVGTGVGYLGVGVALLAALAAMGLGLQQIALIASALSVGIGFGLQQIVQNFVAGIILLVERPVKVGDWVKVDDVEGDVMRIRVRATEVQTFDHSTVIVPNSDFVTKAVRNRTLGQSRGRVQLQVAIANPGEARRACDLIAKAASSDAEVLDKPRPSVFVDSVAPGAINLNCYLYVADPGEAYEIRSRLYLATIEALCEAHIGLAAK
jgi:small-conductance mechanosensitive channel